MFADAIEKVTGFTRPVNTILRTYGSKQVIASSASLFFVNNQAEALTCKHVTRWLGMAEQLNQQYQLFKQELRSITHSSQQLALEKKYGYTNGQVVQMKTTFVDCVNSMSGFTCWEHPDADLALIKFHGFEKILYQCYASFPAASTTVRPGNQLCRIGFPFTAFNNFRYNEPQDDIEWTPTGIPSTPIFPIEGMVTRYLPQQGIEMSTPGYPGHSGGPLFNNQGTVVGIQTATRHLALGTFPDQVSLNNPGGIAEWKGQAVAHLGQCISHELITTFLKDRGVHFSTEPS